MHRQRLLIAAIGAFKILKNGHILVVTPNRRRSLHAFRLTFTQKKNTLFI